MSLRLERGFGGLAGAASAAVLAATLAVAMLALLPAAAGAQTRDESATSVVVRPGDSLWSISEERLGPNASPRRVMKGAERIHELNRERIGADPGLVLVGQELSVPRAMSEPPNGAAVPARGAAEASGPEASGSDPRDRAAKGPAGKEAPREALGRGDIPRSGIPLEEAARMLGAGTASKDAIPEPPRAVAPVPAVRTVAFRDTQPRSFVGFPADASAEGRRRLLGSGIVALALVAAALIAAYGHSTARRESMKWDLWFREAYGAPCAAFEPLAGPEDAPGRVPEARDRTAYPDGPINEGAVSEDRFDLTDPFVLARAKRARVRRQSPRPRARGLRRPVGMWPQGRPSGGRQGATFRAVRKEWEPGADLVGALEGLHLRPRTSPGADLAGLEPHLLEALGELRRLGQWRGLSEREKTRREALEALMAAVERGE